MLDVWVWTRLGGAMLARVLGRGATAWHTWNQVRAQSNQWHDTSVAGASR
jgi:hypothetical protein